MKPLFLILVLFVATPRCAYPQDDEASVRKSLDAYDEAVAKKDVETVKKLLAPEVLVYEHEVRNDGINDAFENHLKPEILEDTGLQLSFSNVRVTAVPGLALITRLYHVKGTFKGKTIDATGNETQVWKNKDGQWKIIHIHYSYPCPRASKPS